MRAILAAAALLLLASAAPAAAQYDTGSRCVAACSCAHDGCLCKNAGGRGSRCDTDGVQCFVAKCLRAVLPVSGNTRLAFAADGSPVTVETTGDGARVVSGSVAAAEWRTLSAGHSVGLSCDGIAVAEFFDTATAARLRDEERTLTI